jgi:trk system potassium uptake protein TrkA
LPADHPLYTRRTGQRTLWQSLGRRPEATVMVAGRNEVHTNTPSVRLLSNGTDTFSVAGRLQADLRAPLPNLVFGRGELMGKGHEVTLIESNRNRYLTVEQELEHVAQYGDATELWVLERAGIQRAELVIAVTGDDEDNILICQIAREKYLCDRIIARVNNPRNRRWFELLDIQPAVSATDLILRLIEHEVPSYGLVHLLDLRDEKLEIIEVEVTDGAPAAGKSVSAVDLPDGALIISVLREDGGFVPKADTMIEAGDEVLLVLDPGLEDRITSQFAVSAPA